ncbi:MAG: uL15 family ribosomal protein [Nanoarchaeota archaeon]
MINKRKKFSRYRGSHTHGGGAKKKRRGAGHRGGRGMAGSGKRADQKKPTILKLYGNEYFGKHGFIRGGKRIKNIKTINIGEVEKNLHYYLEKNLVKKEGNMFVINLNEIGVNKLLGTGNITNKYKFKGRVSKKAKAKVEELGGVVEGS